MQDNLEDFPNFRFTAYLFLPARAKHSDRLQYLSVHSALMFKQMLNQPKKMQISSDITAHIFPGGFLINNQLGFRRPRSVICPLLVK